MIRRCMIALLVLTAATGVSAAEKKDTEEAETSEKDKVVCKTERSTGSLTRKKRVCRTRAQWDELSRSAQKGMNDLVRDSNRGVANTSTVGAGGP